VIVAPITHTKSRLPVVIPITEQYDNSGNTILDGNVLLGNIVCVSKARLGDFITKLPPKEMEKVDEAIAIAVDIKRYHDKLKNVLSDKLDYIDKLNNKIKSLEKEKSKYKKAMSILSKLQKELGFSDFEDMEEQIKLKFTS
jgi:mRNA interferase MazF